MTSPKPARKNPTTVLGWAIVTRDGKFADGRAGYSFFASKRDAKQWMINGEGERIARVKITEIP